MSLVKDFNKNLWNYAAAIMGLSLLGWLAFGSSSGPPPRNLGDSVKAGQRFQTVGSGVFLAIASAGNGTIAARLLTETAVLFVPTVEVTRVL